VKYRNNKSLLGGPLSRGGRLTEFRERRVETPVGGALEYISERITTSISTSASNENRLIGVAPGKSNESINRLSKGHIFNRFFMRSIRNIVRNTGVYPLVEVPAVFWIQGERDRKRSYTFYYKAMKRLQVNLERGVQRVTKQKSAVHLLTYQTAFYSRDGSNQVLFAQLDASKDSNKIHMVTPIYHLPTVPDLIHLTNIGSKLLGKYMGRAYYQMFVDKRDTPDSIVPLNITKVDSNTIRVHFKVPQIPLVLDVSTGHAPYPDYGFAVEGYTITNVQVSDSGTDILVTVDRSLEYSYMVSYAIFFGNPRIYAGAGGNLRDSTPEMVLIRNEQYPLYHMAPHFILKS